MARQCGHPARCRSRRPLVTLTTKRCPRCRPTAACTCPISHTPPCPSRRVWRLAQPAGHARLADRRLLHHRRAAHRGVAAGPRLQAVVCGAAGGLCPQVRRGLGRGRPCSSRAWGVHAPIRGPAAELRAGASWRHTHTECSPHPTRPPLPPCPCPPAASAGAPPPPSWCARCRRRAWAPPPPLCTSASATWWAGWGPSAWRCCPARCAAGGRGAGWGAWDGMHGECGRWAGRASGSVAAGHAGVPACRQPQQVRGMRARTIAQPHPA